MLKAFGKLWLEGAKRLAKAQVAQQKKLQKKLVKSALTAAKTPRVVRTAATAPATRSAPARKQPGAGQGPQTVPRNVAPKRPPKSPSKSATRGSRGSAQKAPQKGPQQTVGATTALDAGGTWSRGYYDDASADTHAGRRRLTYWLYIPAAVEAATDQVAMPMAPTRAKARTALPLVVMLHGCDQTAPDFAGGTRMNQLAARHGFAVMYPQQSVTAHAQRCWPWYKRAVQRGGDEVALVAGATRKVLAQHGFDRTRVYAAGLSAGAALAQTLALRHPQVFAAVASHSGPVFGVADSRIGAFSVMRHGSHDAASPIVRLLRDAPGFPGVPILIVQGQQDNVVRPVNGVQLAQQFCLLNALPVVSLSAPVQRAARGTCDGYRLTDHRRGSKVVVRLCEVDHLAHAWSGGDAALRYNAAQGPDASKLLWDFFKRHRLLRARTS